MVSRACRVDERATNLSSGVSERAKRRFLTSHAPSSVASAGQVAGCRGSSVPVDDA